MKTAKELFDERFLHSVGTPRSLEYRSGYLDGLRLTLGEIPKELDFRCPHPHGTAAADAWFAGADAGLDRARAERRRVSDAELGISE